ncbi:MAG: hypothetical protein Q8M92_07775, partial [Candidatus Subteraquimicrobiales bacterium]|nr:hypothetical protein [Candidatus Subteraquimicrobiales bacterium]
MPDNQELLKVKEKVLQSERLSRDDGLKLINTNDLLFLGELAKTIKKRKSGNYVYFNVNRHINLTNICVSRCKFCAFSRDKNDSDAYLMSEDEAVQAASNAPQDVTEFHIVSGLHPDMPFDYYVGVIRTL